MAKFYPPEKLVFTFIPEPQLIPWDYEKLIYRYYPSKGWGTEARVTKKWLEENRGIRTSHANKLAAIQKVVARCIKAGCAIVEEDFQDTCLDWGSYTPGMAEIPTKNMGPLMRRVTITKGEK